MRDYYEETCSKCKYKDVDAYDSPCKECADAFFDDWKNPKRKFGKYFTDEVLAHEGIYRIPKKLLKRALICFKAEHPEEFMYLLKEGDEDESTGTN